MKKIILTFTICLFINHVFAQINCFVLKSPEKFFPNAKKFAILGFDGKKEFGQAFENYMLSNLISETRGIKQTGGMFAKKEDGKTYIEGIKTNIYQIVERSQLERIINEQNLSNSGLIDDSQAAKLGKILGADIVISGKISSIVNDEMSGSQGDRMLSRTVTTEVTIKLVDVNTAQIIGSKTIKKKSNDIASNSEISGIKSEEQITKENLSEISEIAVSYFAPGFEYMKFKLKEILVKEIREKAENAIEYAKKGDINAAYNIYNAIYGSDNYNAFAAYNLGILNEVTGNFKDSYDFYDTAYQLESKDKDVIEAFKRSEKNLALKENLATIGINIPEHIWPDNSNALADRITTAGTKADRLNVYESKSNTSPVVAKIPGATEFIVIQKESDWVLIKLLGEKKGYISISETKK